MEDVRVILNSYLNEHYPDYDVSKFTAQSDFERATLLMNMLKTNDPFLAVSLIEKDPTHPALYIKAGNSYVADHNFLYALESFNKGIMLAPANSVPYYHGFGNRSVCLSRMGLHKEALLNVEHALKCTGIEPSYEEKLKIQMDICKKLVGLTSSPISAASSCSNVSHSRIPLNRNEYLTSASNKVAMSTNTRVGRHLKAIADIRTGEVIMIEEPYARVLDLDLRFTHCWNCWKYCIVPYPCTKCGEAMFCDQNCLEAAKKYHDFECPIMHLLLRKLFVPRLYLLALHMFLNATEHGNKLNELKQKIYNIDVELKNRVTYDSNDFIRIYNLEYHPTEETADFYFSLTFLAGYLISALSKCTSLLKDASSDLQVFACSVLLRFFLIADCNALKVTAMGLQDGGFLEAGHGICATCCLLNHSCDPNVTRHVFNQSLVVRAIKPIKAGEELNIDYTTNFAYECFSSRQAKLLKDHYFTCRCKACEHRWLMYPSQPLTIPKFKKSIDGTTWSRFTNLNNNFTDTFKLEWKYNKLKLISDVKFTPKIIDWLCEFIDLLAEYFYIPHKRYTEALEVLRIGFENVAGFRRSFGTTEDTDEASPLNDQMVPS